MRDNRHGLDLVTDPPSNVYIERLFIHPLGGHAHIHGIAYTSTYECAGYIEEGISAILFGV